MPQTQVGRGSRGGGDRPRRAAAVALAAITLALGACSAIEAAVESRVAGDGAPQIPIDLDVRVLGWMDQEKVPGATVAVTKGSRLVWSKGYGVADIDSRDQMQPHHRTRIGSVSKLLTTIGLLQLVERGELDFDGPLYASWVQLPWGVSQGQTPSMVLASDGALEHPELYLGSVIAAVEALTPHEASPGYLWDLDPGPPYLHPATSYDERVALALEWATAIRIRHLLSHTSGLPVNGNLPKTAEAIPAPVDEVTYPQLHAAMMRGIDGVPMSSLAGSQRVYSNHAFGLAGQIIAEAGDGTYIEYTEDNILRPLDLHHVVARDLSTTWRDASSYIPDAQGDPRPPIAAHQETLTAPNIATSTGGWIATAADVARIMCGIDTTATNRLLDTATVAAMATIAYPAASSSQPLGWDKRTGQVLTKTGATPRGGAARATKFLPGSGFEDEINVVVAANMHKTPPDTLLQDIAEIVNGVDIPETYDLFQGRCYLPTYQGHGSGGGTFPSPAPPDQEVLPPPTPTEPSPWEGQPVPVDPEPTTPPARVRPDSGSDTVRTDPPDSAPEPDEPQRDPAPARDPGPDPEPDPDVDPQPAPGSSLECLPVTLTLSRGEDTSTRCTVSPHGGFLGTVTLQCDGLPVGLDCSWSSSDDSVEVGPDPVVLRLTITASREARPVSTEVVVTAEGSGVAYRTTLSITITRGAAQQPPAAWLPHPVGWGRRGGKSRPPWWMIIHRHSPDRRMLCPACHRGSSP